MIQKCLAVCKVSPHTHFPLTIPKHLCPPKRIWRQLSMINPNPSCLCEIGTVVAEEWFITFTCVFIFFSFILWWQVILIFVIMWYTCITSMQWWIHKYMNPYYGITIKPLISAWFLICEFCEWRWNDQILWHTHFYSTFQEVIIHHWSYTSGESSNQSCVSIRTHISVTAGSNFLILGMMMGYGLGMMPIFFFDSLVS